MKTNEKQMNIFDIVSNIKTKKIPNLLDKEENLKAFNPYMAIKILGMTDSYLEILNEIDHYQSFLSKKQMYELLFAVLPKKSGYDPYIKSPKNEINDAVNKVAEYYEISKKEALQNIQLMGSNWTQNITKKFGGINV